MAIGIFCHRFMPSSLDASTPPLPLIKHPLRLPPFYYLHATRQACIHTLLPYTDQHQARALSTIDHHSSDCFQQTKSHIEKPASALSVNLNPAAIGRLTTFPQVIPQIHHSPLTHRHSNPCHLYLSTRQEHVNIHGWP